MLFRLDRLLLKPLAYLEIVVLVIEVEVLTLSERQLVDLVVYPLMFLSGVALIMGKAPVQVDGYRDTSSF